MFSGTADSIVPYHAPLDYYARCAAEAGSPEKLQEFFVCHFFIWRSNFIQLLDFLCCCQVRIVLYALFYFSVIHLLPSLVSMLPFVPAGGVTCSAPPGKDEKNFMYQKTMIVITIAFVSCFSWLRSGIERYADRKLRHAVNSSFRGL